MNQFPTVNYVTHDSRPLPKLGVVKFRPFLVGEHRRLLEATQLGDAATVLNTICSIVQACTFDKVQVDKLEMYIIDALYLDIYIKSRGSVNQVNYKCQNMVTTPLGVVQPCGTDVLVNMPLDRAYMDTPEGYEETGVIRISPTAGLKLRQPTLEDYKALKSTGVLDLTDEFVYSSIECIYDGDRLMYPGQDFDMAGLRAYMDTLPDDIMKQVATFFELSPALCIDLPITCPSCKHTETLHLRGLDDFFV